MTWPSYSSRTFCALMVMPRSRSMSIESRYWARMSRGSTAPQYSRMRSARVDFPWSIWAITLMLRMASGRVIACTLYSSPAPPSFRLQSFGVHTRMANIKSQKKRNLQNARRHEKNKAVRSELKTRIKNADRSAAEGGEDTAAAVQRAVKALDMAAAKGVIHKNQAANRKSKLMR